MNQFDLLQLILQCCFKNLIPGILTKLVIQDNSYYSSGFFEATGNPNDLHPGTSRLDLPPEQFEALLLGIRVLRLDGIFPCWTSQAYRGLVELRLTRTGFVGDPIPQSTLYEVLARNPLLRRLEFDLRIEGQQFGGTNADEPPVCLENLEVLKLGPRTCTRLGIFLGLLGPGSTALQLTIYRASNSVSLLQEDEVTRFFQHQRILRLRINSLYPYRCSHVSELLCQTPHLQVLVLDGLFDQQAFYSPPTFHHPSSTLDVLYMLNCRTSLTSLGKLVSDHPARKLVLSTSHIFYGDESSPASDEKVRAELQSLCPFIEHIDISREVPIPIKESDWLE